MLLAAGLRQNGVTAPIVPNGVINRDVFFAY
jgi:hypothetical protein